MNDWIRSRIRTIPDHPKPGILFRDITTLLKDAQGFRKAVDELVQPYAGAGVTRIAGIESRGFILGGAIAHQLSIGFVPVRKKGKLPAAVYGMDYELEYGSDRLEIHRDALTPGDRVLVVDDLVATGGTAAAAVELVRQAGAEIVGCAFIVSLPDLGGEERLRRMGCRVQTLCAFAETDVA